MSPTLSLTFYGLLKIQYLSPLEVKHNGFLSIQFSILSFRIREPPKSIIILMLLSRSPLFLFSNLIGCQELKILRFYLACDIRS